MLSSLMLRDGRKPLVLYRCRKAVGHEHVIPARMPVRSYRCPRGTLLRGACSGSGGRPYPPISTRSYLNEYAARISRGVVIEDRERRGSVPVFTMLWLPVTITSGIPLFDPAGECVQHGRVGRVLGLTVSKRSPAWTSTSGFSRMITSIAAKKLS